jgi:hypothetical protein
MTSDQERPLAKISYEKPTAVDLGPTAPIVGASCVEGGGVELEKCVNVGNAAFACDRGNSADINPA